MDGRDYLSHLRSPSLPSVCHSPYSLEDSVGHVVRRQLCSCLFINCIFNGSSQKLYDHAITIHREALQMFDCGQTMSISFANHQRVVLKENSMERGDLLVVEHLTKPDRHIFSVSCITLQDLGMGNYSLKLIVQNGLEILYLKWVVVNRVHCVNDVLPNGNEVLLLHVFPFMDDATDVQICINRVNLENGVSYISLDMDGRDSPPKRHRSPSLPSSLHSPFIPEDSVVDVVRGQLCSCSFINCIFSGSCRSLYDHVITVHREALLMFDCGETMSISFANNLRVVLKENNRERGDLVVVERFIQPNHFHIFAVSYITPQDPGMENYSAIVILELEGTKMSYLWRFVDRVHSVNGEVPEIFFYQLPPYMADADVLMCTDRPQLEENDVKEPGVTELTLIFNE